MNDSTGFTQEKSAEGPPAQESEPLRGGGAVIEQKGREGTEMCPFGPEEVWLGKQGWR